MRGVAELVDEPALTVEPLANPGKVIKRSRSTTAEQIAALPKSLPSSKRRASEKPDIDPPKPVKHRPTRPTPSRRSSKPPNGARRH